MRKREDRHADEKLQAGTDCDAVEAGGGGDRQRTTTPHAFPEAGITEQTFYCWRKEYSGLNLYQAGRGPATKQNLCQTMFD